MFHSTILVSQSSEKKIESIIDELHIHQVDIVHLKDEAGIEDIRKAQKFLNKKPFSSPQNFLIINGELLTQEAQNALLKTLEEPNETSLILIYVSKLESLLPTIISRSKVEFESLKNEANHDELSIFWSTFLQSSIGKRVSETEKIAKDRTAALEWIVLSINYFHSVLRNQYLNTNHETVTGIEIATLLKLFLGAQSAIESNANVKLALDQLFIKIPQKQIISSTQI